jgi:7 transmembrane sweet-taste receptor of 3 GCPR
MSDTVYTSLTHPFGKCRWSPEPLFQHYLGTDAEMQQVIRRPYTRECAYAREEWKDECASDLETRIGASEEACGDPVEPLRKLINVGLKEALDSPDIPVEAKSPAYEILRFFTISEIQLGELFDAWSAAPSPRDAVCQWAVENLEQHLIQMVPPTYPRVVRENAHSPFGITSMIVGGVATLVVLVTTGFVFRMRNEPSIQYAQIDFLTILLVGSFFVGIGSVLLSAPASQGTCISSIWFVNLGYTLELVPLILKVAAINRLMSAAQELRRIRVKRSVLYKAVASISFVIIAYLAAWTVVSPPAAAIEYSMTDTVTTLTEVVVGKTIYCRDGSDTNTWQFVAVAWNLVLLLCASVLAFQSRNVIQVFNESRTLAMLIYSHFIFVVARISIIYFGDRVGGSNANYSLSLIYALDQITACGIYFFPKLLSTAGSESNSSTFSFGGSPSHFRGSMRLSSSIVNRRNTADSSNLIKRQCGDASASSDRFLAGSAPQIAAEATSSSIAGEVKNRDSSSGTHSDGTEKEASHDCDEKILNPDDVADA